MAGLTRRAALAAFGVLGAGGTLGYLRRGALPPPAAAIRLTDGGGCMGAGPMEMRRYMEMFMRHSEIRRVVEDIPGGVRTTTESDSPALAGQLQAHVSSMYAHLDQGIEVRCMSESLARTRGRSPGSCRTGCPPRCDSRWAAAG